MENNHGFISGAVLPRVKETVKGTQPTASSSKQEKLGKFFKPPLGDTSERKIKRRDRTMLTLGDCWRTLTEVFGHNKYKGNQKEVIESAICGVDVFVVAPTGMGKSICFQVPATAEKHGVTFVISPLLALMKNQVSRLQELKIPAASYTSDALVSEKKKVMADLQSVRPTLRLLYITPEMLSTAEFNKLVAHLHRKGEINRLVIDEAHCVSEWGHDFRPEYRKLGFFRESYPDVPIMALTASATTSVQSDIVKNLRLDHEKMFKVVHPFNRDNLFYEFIALLHQRRGRPSSGIVYCRSRVTCDELSQYLRSNGIQSRSYHRGLKSRALDKTLKEWQHGGDGTGGVDVVCATIAFGMGIDKPDVRYVIHFDFPKSLEGYYQETGRAGRDGDPAKCVLYYSREDALRVRQLVKLSQRERKQCALTMPLQYGEPEINYSGISSFRALVNLAEDVTQCRHISICKYFGEEIDTSNSETRQSYCNNMCDICKYPDKTKKRKKALNSEDWIVSQIEQLQRASAEEAMDIADVDMDELDSGFEDGDWGHASGVDDEDDYPKIQEQDAPLMKGKDKTHSTHLSVPLVAKPLPATKRPAPTNSYSINRTKRPKVDYSHPIGGLSTAPCRQYKVPFTVPFKEVPQNNVVHAEDASPTKSKDSFCSENEENQVTKPAFESVHVQDVESCIEQHPRDEDPAELVEIESSDHEMDQRNTVQLRGRKASYSSSNDSNTVQTSDHDQECEGSESSEEEISVPMEDSRACSLSPEEVRISDEDDREDVAALEMAFSQKIRLTLREDTLSKIKTTLHNVFMKDEAREKLWKNMGVRTPWHDERSKLLAQAASALEFRTFLMSATDMGYRHRAEWKVSAIEALVNDEAWDVNGEDEELADARAVALTMRSVVKDGK